MSDLKVNSNGIFTTPKVISVNQNGVWTPAKAVWINNAGVWVKAWTNIPPGLIISANAANYDIATALGNPILPVNTTVTINSGVIVYSTASALPALTTGALPAGSTVTIINNGSIYGAGGRGGDYDVVAQNVTNGDSSPGGDAISTSVPIIIDNTNGYIFGGGGGGAAAGYFTNGFWDLFSAAGGGQGYVGGESGASFAGTYYGDAIVSNATSGSPAGPGVGAVTEEAYGTPTPTIYAGAGGTWGQPGAPNTWSGYYDITTGAFAFGAGGYAVRTNGNLVDITSGNNPNQIKGFVA